MYYYKRNKGIYCFKQKDQPATEGNIGEKQNIKRKKADS